MALTRDVPRSAHDGLRSPSVLLDWNMDEARRQLAQQTQEIRTLRQVIRTLQETIRGSTRMAVDLQRSLIAKDRRIRELQETVRFLENEVYELRSALRPLS